MISLIGTEGNAATPKYQQVVNAVIAAIDDKRLSIGDKIPSVNEVSESTGFAKKTVVQAFDYLKQSGIISSVKYKGYYVASANTQSRHNLFVLFNSLTAYKEEIYESMKERLADQGVVDIFFHHNKAEVFNTLIAQSAGKYTAYIIMPLNDPANMGALQQLPQDKIYILDLGYESWGTRYPSVCQYFEEDMYACLQAGLHRIGRYEKLILVLNPLHYNVKLSEKGFLKFCHDHGFAYEVIYQAKNRKPATGELYVVVDDQDLVCLVKQVQHLQMKLGEDVGIISYNEIPFKEIAANGIATISTDFARMGQSIIELVLNKDKKHLRNPSRLIERSSF